MSPRGHLAAELATLRTGDARRAYLESHVFELLIAALAVLSAAIFFVEPGELARTAVGRALHPFDYAWNLGELVGGSLIVAGLWRPEYRLELAGLVMFTGALLGAGIAVIAARGIAGLGSLAIYLAAAGASVVRVGTIRRVEAALDEVKDELELRQSRTRRGDR